MSARRRSRRFAGNGNDQRPPHIGVRCPAANSWTIYVPVTVEVEVSVLVLRRPLARRARVELVDVEPQVRRLPGSAPRSSMTSPACRAIA